MISSDNIKAIAYASAGLLAAYALYRVYQTGESAKESVAQTVKGIGDWIDTTYKKIVPTTPPDLSQLPSSGDYPEAGPIRREGAAAAQATEDRNQQMLGGPMVPIALNETGSQWAVAADQRTYSPEPFDIYPGSRAA